MKRLVQPELLDALPPDDPRAVRSRGDLHRINWWMRNHSIMAGALKEKMPAAPIRITELGAGDGKFLLSVAGKCGAGWSGLAARLLDFQKVVSPETLAALARRGWRAEVVVADVLDWTPSQTGSEVVVANLFLHHFADETLVELLRKVARHAKLFVAVEPHRFARPALVGPLLRLIGCNEVTRHDAVVSIRAGFAGAELSGFWPDQTNWQLTERRAGPFSHLFVARKIN